MNNVNVVRFYPVGHGTKSITAASTTGRVQIQAAPYSHHVRIYNSSADTVAFVEFGNSTITATTTDSMPIAPGEVEVFSCPCEYVAAITASGTAVVYITPGEGI